MGTLYEAGPNSCWSRESYCRDFCGGGQQFRRPHQLEDNGESQYTLQPLVSYLPVQIELLPRIARLPHCLHKSPPVILPITACACVTTDTPTSRAVLHHWPATDMGSSNTVSTSAGVDAKFKSEHVDGPGDASETKNITVQIIQYIYRFVHGYSFGLVVIISPFFNTSARNAGRCYPLFGRTLRFRSPFHASRHALYLELVFFPILTPSISPPSLAPTHGCPISSARKITSSTCKSW